MSDLSVLVTKLNDVCRRALEAAAALCVAQTHYNVEIEHLLLKLLEIPGTDVAAILDSYAIAANEVTSQLERATERFGRGNSRTPALSPHITHLLRESWVHASLLMESPSVRSAAILLALIDDDALRATIHDSCPSLARIPRESLADSIAERVRNSIEETSAPRFETMTAPAAGSALERFTVDLTADARAGRIDPIRGRDVEIRQVIDILTRRRQNNPILVGDAGVGKTAVAEGFAMRIAAGEVPPSLRNIAVRALDLGLLQAGAGFKGEFEERLKSVIAEVRSAAPPVILFIDEAHTLIGAGNQAGQGDAANLLKPALARGELRTIAATTWSEYKKYFEKDPALTRRFQLVKVEEPDEAAALDMLRGVAPQLEQHHGVPILDDAVHSAVQLSHRYLSERRLPDKAISVLDTAAARVALAQETVPSAIEDLDRRIRIAEADAAVLRRADGETAELEKQLAAMREERERLAARWQRERDIVAQLRSANGDGAALREELAQLQEIESLVPFACDARAVAAVISGWTGIPAGRVLAGEIPGVLALNERLGERIVGQPQALDAICRRISTSRAGLEDPAKPKGVFLLCGPTGVGKTETALALAEVLYGGERNLISFNMSEFQEPHSVATLKGAPPGYVGYGRGGVLTEAVRRRPWSAVLLDEIEKAHPDVVDLFYQVFDKGVLEDGEGVPVDFRHTVMLLTSNTGAEVIGEACRRTKRPPASELMEPLREALLNRFRPALLARLVIVPYYPLTHADIVRIVELKLGAICRRIRENHNAELTYDPRLVDSLAARCEPSSGAREVDQIFTQSFLPELSTRILERMAKGVSFANIHVTVDAQGRFL
jgi:type VI secretion system protein VasG